MIQEALWALYLFAIRAIQQDDAQGVYPAMEWKAGN